MGDGRSRSSPISAWVSWISQAWPVGIRVAWGRLSWQALAGKLTLPSLFLTESLPQPAGRRNHPEVLIELSQGCQEAQKTDVSPSSCG